MVDNDGNFTAGGVLLISMIVFAPFILAMTLVKLFFRAPLAAIFGGIFTLALFVLGILLLGAVTAGMDPVGVVFTAVLFLGGGAGLCYRLRPSGHISQFFEWESLA
jgi:hypothetical protein